MDLSPILFAVVCFFLSVGKSALVTLRRRPEMPIYGRVEPSAAQDSEVNNIKSAWQVIQGIFIKTLASKVLKDIFEF